MVITIDSAHYANLRISFNTSYFWIGLGQDFQATLWIGLDWIHELMDWIESGKMDPCPTLSS